MSQPSDIPESIILSGEQILQLTQQYPWLWETIEVFRKKTSDAQTLKTTTEPVNEYTGLATEHAELLKQGKTSLEIAGWLGEKLNIASWKAGQFHGERKVLSTPTEEEMARLQELTQALGISWTKANGWSDNHSQFFLMDGYVQNALFGQANMQEVNERLYTFHTDWQAMWRDFAAKAQYLKDKIGLDIHGDWNKLTGIRSDDGDFDYSDVLYASGSLDGRVVHRVWLNRAESSVDLVSASVARLCFLA